MIVPNGVAIAEVERAVRAAQHVQSGGHGDGLAGGERRARDEAPALPIGVGLDRVRLCAPLLDPTTVRCPIWPAGMPRNVIWVWGSALVVFGLGNTATSGCASATPGAASQRAARRSATNNPLATPDHRRDLNLSRNLLQPPMETRDGRKRCAAQASLRSVRIRSTGHGPTPTGPRRTPVRRRRGSGLGPCLTPEGLRLDPDRTPRARPTYLSGAMRFASVVHEGNHLAVAIDGDRAVPMQRRHRAWPRDPSVAAERPAARPRVEPPGRRALQAPGRPAARKGDLRRAELRGAHRGDQARAVRLPGAVPEVRHHPHRAVRPDPAPARESTRSTTRASSSS